MITAEQLDSTNSLVCGSMLLIGNQLSEVMTETTVAPLTKMN